MATTTSGPSTGPDTGGRVLNPRAPWIGLGVALSLVLAAFVVPPLFGWEVFSRAPGHPSNSLDPIIALFEPIWFGPGTLPALAIALLGFWYAADNADRLPWRRLLLFAYVGGLGWLLALAAVRGEQGFAAPLAHPYEYMDAARAMTDVPAALEVWVDRIPLDAENNWTVHVAGHPPLATLMFVFLARIGLGGDLSAGLVVTAIAAATAPAVLVTLKALDAERLARVAAPFLVLTPAAVFMAVSADAVFAATAAWGMAALAIAATANSRSRQLGFSALAGLLLGCCVMMSYGLPLLGVLAVAVLVAARSWKPLPVAAAFASLVVLLFAAYGFYWWEAFPVLRDRYWDGLASDRPGGYWTWANLAALVISGGPLMGAGVAMLRRGTDRAVLWLAGAGVLMVVVADLSQMSRSEVERIWLPFIPWITLSVVLLPERWRRWGLGLQLACALVVEHLLSTAW